MKLTKSELKSMIREALLEELEDDELEDDELEDEELEDYSFCDTCGQKIYNRFLHRYINQGKEKVFCDKCYSKFKATKKLTVLWLVLESDEDSYEVHTVTFNANKARHIYNELVAENKNYVSSVEGCSIVLFKFSDISPEELKRLQSLEGWYALHSDYDFINQIIEDGRSDAIEFYEIPSYDAANIIIN